MKKLFFLALLCMGLLVNQTTPAHAQGVGVNSTGAQPDPSSMLDVSSTDKGALLPRMTTAERDLIGAPATGLIIYNLDCNNFNYFDGTAWVAFNINPATAPGAPGAISGPVSVCANSTGNVYSIASIPGASNYTWVVPSGSVITSGQGTASVTVTFGNVGGNVSVEYSNACGTSSPSALAVNLQANPATPGAISGFNTIIPGQADQVTYAVNPVAGATSYSWTIPTGANIVSGAGTHSIIVDYDCNAVSGDISVTASASCGTSAPSTLSITANRLTVDGGGIMSGYCGAQLGGSPTASDGQAPYTYVWNPGTGLSSTTVANPSATPASSTNYTLTVNDANGCVDTGFANLTIGVSTNSQTFAYSGVQDTFTVPAGVGCIQVEAYGAQGGSTTGASGGQGGKVTTSIVVTPGSDIYLNVGGSTGFNGGGNAGGRAGSGGTNGGAGGGASDLRIGSDNLSDRVVIAGGGGGSGGQGCNSACAEKFNGGNGGNGGHPAGENGENGRAKYNGPGYGGFAGNQSAGGNGGAISCNGNTGSNGTLGQGGNGGNATESSGSNSSGGGAGGGGGYYGGGGGGSGCYTGGGGGGGGSSYVSPSGTSNTTYQTGVQTGNGQIIISW